MSKNERDSISNSSSGTPSIGVLRAYDDSHRVYEELGSRKACLPLIDSNKTPKLMLEKDLKLRLHSVDAKEKDCKIYIFSDFLLIGSKRLRKRLPKGEQGGMDESTGMTTESSSQDALIFGSNKASDDSSSKAEDEYDSDASYYKDELNALKEQEEAEIRAKRKYNLKMWVDLAKIKLSVHRKKGKYGIKIIYTKKNEIQVAHGEVRYNTIVDQAEVWFENESLAKSICGIIQEHVHRKGIEEVRRLEKIIEKEKEYRNDSMITSGSDPESVPSDDNSKSSSNKTKPKRRGRGKMKHKKAVLKKNAILLDQSEKQRFMNKEVIKASADLAQRYKVFDEIRGETTDTRGVAEEDEGDDAIFEVIFKKAELGFALAQNPNIVPFISRIDDNGLAAISGVTLGDRILAVNDIDMNVGDPYSKCIQAIKGEWSKGKNVKITFQRKQKAEINRILKEEQQAEANKEFKEREDKENALENEAVIPVSDAPFINHQKTLKGEQKNLVLKRLTEKTAGGFNRYTLKKEKKKKRRFKQKRDIMQTMQHTITNIQEFKEYKKNKERMFELYEEVETLFTQVPRYLDTKEERHCFFALKEIYETECAYNTQLNALRGLQVALLTARKNVICKNLKSSKPFCEHRRPKRYCAQESSTREEAVDHKEVNSIFLNLKPIIKSNQYLFKNLQAKLGELYKLGESGEKLEVYQFVELFSDVFAEIAPFLKIYWQYCKRYRGACAKQKKLRENNKYFYDIVKPVEKQLNISLPNLLSRPVLRITKYTLLFTTLKKYVNDVCNHPKVKQTNALKAKLDATSLKLDKACENLLALANKVNASVGNADDLDKMNDAYNEIGGEDKVPRLLEPWRRLVVNKEPCQFEHSGERDIKPECLLYIFNDKLVVATQATYFIAPVVKGKGSFPRNAVRKLGVSGRPSSFTKTNKRKKTSIRSVGSTPDEKRKTPKKKISSPRLKKKSSFRSTLRLSNQRLTKTKTNKTTTTRLSLSSQSSKGDTDFQVLVHFPLRRINSVHSRKKRVDEVDYFAVDVWYTTYNSKKETEDAECILWFKDAGKSKDLIKQLNSLREEDRKKREENQRNRENVKRRQRQNSKKKKPSGSVKMQKKSSLRKN